MGRVARIFALSLIFTFILPTLSLTQREASLQVSAQIAKAQPRDTSEEVIRRTEAVYSQPIDATGKRDVPDYDGRERKLSIGGRISSTFGFRTIDSRDHGLEVMIGAATSPVHGDIEIEELRLLIGGTKAF